MRVIRPALTTADRVRASVTALLMLVVGWIALLQVALLPDGRTAAGALLAVSAALGIGVGSAGLIRAHSIGRRRPADGADDLVARLRGAFDDATTLVVAPRLPGVPNDLAALLIGPSGLRAVLVRRWRGGYRVRGRSWDYDTGSAEGWISCRSNPSFDADRVADAVTAWARTALDEPGLTAIGVVAFPRTYSRITLEEPGTEVLTADNGPWWAHSIGRLQRLDARRAGRVLQAVIDAGEQMNGIPREKATPAPEAASD
jgi:hypothetical protein